MEEFRVPKRRVPAQFVLPGGAVRDVAVFLAEATPGHSGGERLSDLLNGQDRFLPALDVGTDAMIFVHSSGLAVARVAAEHEISSGDAEQLTIPTEHEVEVRLMDGNCLSGLISYVLPEGRSRLTDYLNDAPAFFRLIEPERVALVNKRYVAYVESIRR